MKQNKPVKVRAIKRKNVLLTVIFNLDKSKYDFKEISSNIKKRLGIGGSIAGEELEFQGHKVEEIKKLLKEMGIKAQ
jgi:translation initiation factor 1 (eIF-1/SUI1)